MANFYFKKVINKKWNIILLVFILLFLPISEVKSNYIEEYSPSYNFRDIKIKDSDDNKFELEFLLFTFDMLRTNRIEFSNSPQGPLLRTTIAFNVYIETKMNSTIKFDLNKIKLIVDKKEISPVILHDIENPIKYTEVGTIGFPVTKFPDFNFENFKLAIETKKGKKYININRNNLMYDFTDKFRKNFPDDLDHPYVISKPKLLVLNNDNKLEAKRNLNRDSTSNIYITFNLKEPSFLWFRDPIIRCEWYNKNGFYDQEIINHIENRKFKFSLDKNDIKENVGVWSVLIYIDNHLISHRTFLVY